MRYPRRACPTSGHANRPDLQVGWPARKDFFFEKKKQKTFVFLARPKGSRLPPSRNQVTKILVFFKKNILPLAQAGD